MQARDIDLKKYLPQKYLAALDIVKQNSQGAIYLIGGAVYRTIARELHGTTQTPHDFDFLVETTNQSLTAPEGWAIQTNRYGNPKFTHEKLTVDLVPIRTIHSIISRKLDPTLENYLKGTPFDIQSIAYDTKNDRVIGKDAFDSLDSKIVNINNYAEAFHAAEKKGHTGSLSYLRAMAKSLDFQPVYI